MEHYARKNVRPLLNVLLTVLLLAVCVLPVFAAKKSMS